MKTVAFHTLGCKLNFSETSTIARQFRDAGWKRVEYPGHASVYVINTCSVTENADRECRLIVNRAMAENPEGRVIVVGCYAQLKPDDIASIPGVDLVLGATEKFNVLNYLVDLEKREKALVMSCEIADANQFITSYSSNDRTRVFLKVQDGCDYSCTFCTIPLARGKSRGANVQQVIEQAKMLVENGTKEIVLTGINLGDFGIQETSGKHQQHFIDLVNAFEEVDGLQRIRISSIEPNLLTDEIINAVAASEKFVPHFHIPLQSGSDSILKAMRRRYLSELYQSRIHKIKSLMPHAGIGADVIVGFPGESDSDFMETFNFIQKLDISYLHVFTYSERANTPAASMKEVVPMKVRKERNRILRNLSLKKQRAFNETQIGLILPVLFEAEKHEDVMYGYTGNYVRVAHEYSPELVNEIVDCRINCINSAGFAEVSLLYEPVTAMAEA